MTSAPSAPAFNPKAKYATKVPRKGTNTDEHRAEHLIEEDIVKYLKGVPGLVQWKMGVDGWPDRNACYLGFFLGIEVKSSDPSHKATPRQQQRIEAIRNAGGIAIVAHSVEDVRKAIDRIRRCVMPARLIDKRASLKIPGQLPLAILEKVQAEL